MVAEAPGLFFCGLAFQYAFSSMVLPGVGRDADYVAGMISQRGDPVAGARPGEPSAYPLRPGGCAGERERSEWFDTGA